MSNHKMGKKGLTGVGFIVTIVIMLLVAGVGSVLSIRVVGQMVDQAKAVTTAAADNTTLDTVRTGTRDNIGMMQLAPQVYVAIGLILVLIAGLGGGAAVGSTYFG